MKFKNCGHPYTEENFTRKIVCRECHLKVLKRGREKRKKLKEEKTNAK